MLLLLNVLGRMQRRIHVILEQEPCFAGVCWAENEDFCSSLLVQLMSSAEG